MNIFVRCCISWQIFNEIVVNQDLYRNKDELKVFQTTFCCLKYSMSYKYICKMYKL